MTANDIIQRNAECARKLLEAGAEIERLTAERDEWYMRALKAEDDNERLRKCICDMYSIWKNAAEEREAEIARLLAALHQLQGCDIDNAAQDIIIRALEPKP